MAQKKNRGNIDKAHKGLKKQNEKIKAIRRHGKKNSKTVVELPIKGDDEEPIRMVLTQSQDDFCEYVAEGLSLPEAYRKAYPRFNGEVKELNRRAKTVYQMVEVQARLSQLIMERKNSINIDEKFVIEHLKKTVEENPNTNVSVRALELLGKYLAMFADRKIVEDGTGQRDLAQQMFERRQRMLRGEEVTPLKEDTGENVIEFEIKDGTDG